MRILVLNYEFPPLGGGAAPVSKELAIQSVKAGHKVDVITMGFKGIPVYEQIEGVRVYRIKCLRKKQSSCQPLEQLTYLISIRMFLKNHMRKNHYDICHCHFVVPTGEAARYVKKTYRIPYIITAHGSDVEGHNLKSSNRILHRIIRPLWRRIVNDAEAIVAPSKYLKDLMNGNFPGSKYQVIQNGIDIEKYQSLSNPSYKEKRILFMGRLQESKNVQMLLKAVSLVDMQGWKVDIVGDGPYRRHLERMVKELHLQKLVQFHGWLPSGGEEQLSLLKKASLFVSESLFESFGMAVVEAVASGCSVLLSDIEAHRELIQGADCFTQINDVEALAEKLQAFIMGKREYSVDGMLIKRYSWKYIAEKYELIYEKVCDSV